ncbi:hypothetical protein [Nitrosomonas nitrosa]|uniref:hypothetical protein n=1 Tax=Nitrosomonas nitrosa TaxID=52442 RepID=UPI001EF9E455|nr:hypothetical protein [Nitrosomonas nitrosa]
MPPNRAGRCPPDRAIADCHRRAPRVKAGVQQVALGRTCRRQGWAYRTKRWPAQSGCRSRLRHPDRPTDSGCHPARWVGFPGLQHPAR